MPNKAQQTHVSNLAENDPSEITAIILRYTVMTAYHTKNSSLCSIRTRPHHLVYVAIWLNESVPSHPLWHHYFFTDNTTLPSDQQMVWTALLCVIGGNLGDFLFRWHFIFYNSRLSLLSHLSAVLSARVRLCLCQRLMCSSLQRHAGLNEKQMCGWMDGLRRGKGGDQRCTVLKEGEGEELGRGGCQECDANIWTQGTTSCQNHKTDASGNVMWHLNWPHFGSINHNIQHLNT